jgi:tRNA uridine 5-carboxymethylaminomethyl modification enzyme
LSHPEVTFDHLIQIWPELAKVPRKIAEAVEIDGRYAAYLTRQEADIAAFRRDESLVLPGDIEYRAVPELSNEIKELLHSSRPATLGAAGRLPGMTPAAMVILLRFVRRRGDSALRGRSPEAAA